MKNVEYIEQLVRDARKYSYEALYEGLALFEVEQELAELSFEEVEFASSQLHLALKETRVDKDIIRRAGLIATKEVVDTELAQREENQVYTVYTPREGESWSNDETLVHKLFITGRQAAENFAADQDDAIIQRGRG